MAGVGINLSGSDWLGIGKAIGDTTTARNQNANPVCGPRPLCVSVFNRKCSDKMDIYNECMKSSLAVNYTLDSNNQRLAEKNIDGSQQLSALNIINSTNIKKIGYVTLGIVSIIIVIIIINRRKNRL